VTEQQPEQRHRRPGRGSYAVSVSQAQSVAGTILANGPKRLMGWSLVSGAAVTAEAQGRVVAPAAGATIASIAGLVAGDYLVTWSVELDGAAAAAELNNFQLFNGAAAVLQSDNPAAAGTYPQPGVVVTAPAAGSILVKAVGAGTAAIGYSAQITAALLAGGAIGNILDGGQVVGVASTGQDQTDVQWMGETGVYIGTSVAVQATAGKLSGCLYVRDVNDGSGLSG
jgi:hypothetical protein